MRNLKFLVAFALLCLFVSAIGPAHAGVANPPNIPVPANPAGWCTSTALQPGTVRTTQIGDCPAPPPTSCPAGRITTTVLSWRYDGVGRKSMDVTKAENIFGKLDGNAAPVLFPWNNQFTVFWGFPRTPGAYFAAQFTVPANADPVAWGMFTKGETLPGPLADYTISERCGDFSETAQYCSRVGVGVGGRAGAWKLASAPFVAACLLRPGRTYYVNGRLTNPAADHHDCSGATCKMTLQHNRNP